MDIGGYLSVVRRWWWVLALATVIAAGAGYLVAMQQDRLFEAQARLLVGPVNTDLNTQRGAGQLALSYAQLISSQAITEPVIQRLGLATTPAELADRITAGSSDITRLVTIRVTDPDPALAAQIANALAEQLGVVAASGPAPEGLTRIVDVAVPPTSPVSPQVSLLMLLAGAAGFITALSLAILAEYGANSLRSPEELTGTTGAPLLEVLHSSPGLTTNERERKRYELLSTRLESMLEGAPPAVLMVVGANEQVPAGMVAANLARGFADRGVTCVLVDANSASPEASRAFGIAPDPRLPQLLDANEVQLRAAGYERRFEAEAKSDDVALWVLPAGAGRGASKQAHVDTAIDTIGKTVSVIVIAAGSFAASPEPHLWARRSSAAVLVAPQSGLRRADLTCALDGMRTSGVRLLGIVQTGAQSLITKIARTVPRRLRLRQGSALRPDFGRPPGTVSRRSVRRR